MRVVSAERVFVTGSRGFAGTHLTAELERIGRSVVHYDADIRDADTLRRAVRQARPTAVVHLAAAASVAASWGPGSEVEAVNVGGTRNLLVAVGVEAPEARVLAVSSAEVYGVVPPDQQPIAETYELVPSSPYGQSKVDGEAACAASGLDPVIARPFPHIGPHQDARFAIASFAKQIAEIERGEHEPVIAVGNLDALRDLADVRDTVAAYVALLDYGGDERIFNVATGHARRIGDVLDALLSLARTSVTISQDLERLRPTDLPLLCGDPTRIMHVTDWRPQIDFETTLADTLSYWRDRGAS